MKKNILLLILSKYIDSYRGLPSACWAGVLVSFFDSVLVGVFYFLAIYFVNDLQLSPSSAGIIISACGLGAVLGGYVGGLLSDRFKPVTVSGFALAVQGLAYLFLIKLVSLQALVIDSLVMGFASYVFITSSHLVVLRLCGGNGSQRVKALNLLSASSNFGSGVSGLLLGYFIPLGFHRIFFTTAVFSVLLGILVIQLGGRIDHLTEDSIVDCNDRNDGDYFSPSSLFAVLFAVIGIGMVVSQLGATYPIYIQEKFSNIGMSAVSILFAINSFLVVIIATPVGNYCDKYNKLLMVAVGGILICLGMFILTTSSLFEVAILACVVFTFGEVIFFSMAQYVCYHTGIKSGSGKSLGVFRATYAISKIAGPIFGGYIYQYFSGDMVWNLSLLTGFICFAVIVLVARSTTNLTLVRI